MKAISIVIPVFKSRDTLELLFERLTTFSVENTDFLKEIIFVDDASNDGTLDRLLELSKKSDLSIQIVSLHQNRGQYTATAVGLGYATAEWIVTLDDDLQHDPFDILDLFEKAQEGTADLVYGVFPSMKQAFWRNLGSIILRKILASDGFNTSEATGFRLLHRDLAKRYQALRQPISFLDAELCQQAFGIDYVSVKHKERENGKSSYSKRKLFKQAKTLLFHTSFPLKFITRVGLYTSLICLVLVGYFIYNKYVNDVQLGFTALIVSIFLSTGIILFSLGIIGEYVRQIWLFHYRNQSVNHRIIS